MAYDSVNKKISAPVSFYDVQLCLGTDLTYLNELCTHINVNKWSKYKPVVNDNIFTSVSPEWWLGNDGKCGLKITEYGTLAALIAAYNSGTIDWAYQKPTGGAASPYRLTDFKGYYHDATSPLLDWSSNEYALNIASDSTLLVSMQTRAIDAIKSINLFNISDFRDWYFGAVMTNGAVVKACSCATTVLDADFNVNIPIFGTPIGEYDLYPFISNLPIDKNPTKFVALDGFTKKITQIYNSQYSITIIANWDVYLTTCSYTINIQNRGRASIIKNPYVFIRDGSAAWNASFKTGEALSNLYEVSTIANDITIINGTVKVTNHAAFPTWRFWFIGDGGNIKESVDMK